MPRIQLIELLRTLENLGPGLTVDYTEAKIGEFVGVKYFVKEPKHKRNAINITNLPGFMIIRFFINVVQNLILFFLSIIMFF